MTRVFLDCEFNGFNGKLMSMALVPEDDESIPFYKEIIMTDQLDPWVKENVVPHMISVPVTYHEFQMALGQFLYEIGECTVIADWPDDIRYFCEALITGPGHRLGFISNIKFELDFGIEYDSLTPHNALADAKAIKKFYLAREKRLAK